MKSKVISFSNHFDLKHIGDDILVAIAKDGGAAICNAGIVDLGGLILVYDTFLTPQAAQDLKRCAVEIFGRSPNLVINSHYHNDHIWGNQVFAGDAQIISSEKTRTLIISKGREELKWYYENSGQKLEENRKKQIITSDPVEITEFAMWEGYYGGLVTALPELKLCLPTITFDHHLEVHGSRGSARLFSFEGAHTESDSVLFLPRSGVVFMSDLLFVQMHPYLAEGDPFIAKKVLEELMVVDARCFIPGHGPVGTVDDLRNLTAYIEQSIYIAQELCKGDLPSEEAISTRPVPAGSEHWRFSNMFRRNIQAFCQRFKASK